MANLKDNFSEQAGDYSVYRPGYPQALFDFILSLTAGRDIALDVATGNGQVAGVLAEHFKKVRAIDISERQLQHSIRKETIFYSVAAAEKTGFESGLFDLITVGQAAHWFQLPLFYEEVKRLLKPGGILALFGYRLPESDQLINKAIHELYDDLLGAYWDPERKIVDAGYETLLYPFTKISHPSFHMDYWWTCEQLKGYLGTWSAVQHYRKQTGIDPNPIIAEKIETAWGNERLKKITFPVFLLASKME